MALCMWLIHYRTECCFNLASEEYFCFSFFQRCLSLNQLVIVFSGQFVLIIVHYLQERAYDYGILFRNINFDHMHAIIIGKVLTLWVSSVSTIT